MTQSPYFNMNPNTVQDLGSIVYGPSHSLLVDELFIYTLYLI